MRLARIPAAVTAGVVASLLAATAVNAVSVAPTSNGLMTSCVKKGAVRLVATAAACSRGETKSSLGWLARGAWSASAIYLPGSVVSRPSGSFVATRVSKGKAPESNPSTWTMIAAGGRSSIGPSGSAGPIGLSGAPGLAGAHGTNALPTIIARSVATVYLPGSTATVSNETLSTGKYALRVSVDPYPAIAAPPTLNCILYRTGNFPLGLPVTYRVPGDFHGDDPFLLLATVEVPAATTWNIYLQCDTDVPVYFRSITMQAIPVTALH